MLGFHSNESAGLWFAFMLDCIIKWHQHRPQRKGAGLVSKLVETKGGVEYVNDGGRLFHGSFCNQGTFASSSQGLFMFFSFFFFLQNSPNKGKDVDVQPTSNLFQLCDYEPKCGRCVLNFLKIVWYLTISTPYVNLHLKGHCVVQF